MSDEKEIIKPKDTIEASYYKYLSRGVETYDNSSHSSKVDYKKT